MLCKLIGWWLASIFSFDISSEYHACKTFHSACKTSDRFSMAVLSANTCYVVAHSRGGQSCATCQPSWQKINIKSHSDRKYFGKWLYILSILAYHRYLSAKAWL